jgi:hypothetical protein
MSLCEIQWLVASKIAARVPGKAVKVVFLSGGARDDAGGKGAHRWNHEDGVGFGPPTKPLGVQPGSVRRS